MKCLVTGGAGFVGTNLIKRLINDGHQVVSIDNYSTGFKDNHQEGCNYVDGDICNSWGTLEPFGKFDIIFHLAALARIQPSISSPKETIENNFNGTLKVLEFARQHQTSLIYAGSSSKHHGLYGSPYAWSKYGGEELCKLYSEVYDLPTSICRFYNVYGPNHIRTGDYATVIGIFEDQFFNNKPLTIVGDGEQRRDFTHIDDIVEGLIKVFRGMHGEIDMRFAGEIFELGTGRNYSINEVADMFGGEKKYLPDRPGEYDVTLCDYSKAELTLGYKPKGSLKKYIAKIIGGNK